MIQSPCIGICQINKKTKSCVGCQRTVKEIQNWYKSTDEYKENVLKEIKERIK